jgi:hypothetical protein
VVDGTADTVTSALSRGSATAEITTRCPTTSPWAAVVVTVATLETITTPPVMVRAAGDDESVIGVPLTLHPTCPNHTCW